MQQTPQEKGSDEEETKGGEIREEVIKALSELDTEALENVAEEKVPALRKAISKEYNLTLDEVRFILDSKRQKPKPFWYPISHLFLIGLPSPPRHHQYEHVLGLRLRTGLLAPFESK